MAPRLNSMPAMDGTSAARRAWRAGPDRLAVAISAPSAMDVALCSKRTFGRGAERFHPRPFQRNRPTRARTPKCRNATRSRADRMTFVIDRHCTAPDRRHRLNASVTAHTMRGPSLASDSRERSQAEVATDTPLSASPLSTPPPDRYWMPPSPRHRYDGEPRGSSPRRIVRRPRSRDRPSACMPPDAEIYVGCVCLYCPDRPHRPALPCRLA